MKDFMIDLDYDGVLNLHKALLKAKFHLDPDNELVSGSPFVADVSIQLRELLVQKDESGRWKSWFQLENQPYYRKRAVLRMRKHRQWEKASSDEKKKIAERYLAPFICKEQELMEVIAEISDPPGG